MVYFTSGERRGLIILACILALLVSVHGIRELWVRSSDAESAAVSVPAVSDDSASLSADSAGIGCCADTLRLKGRLSGDTSGSTERKARKRIGKSSGKSKKEQGRGKVLPPPRHPLDEPVN